MFFRERGLHPDRFRGSIGRPGQIVCRRSMPVDSRCAHSFSKSWKDFQSTVCSGSPTRCRSALATEGMEVPEWSKFSDPHFRARRSRGGRVDSWLAITRVCCSRCPLVKGVLPCQLTTRFQIFHQPPHQTEDHLHSRRTARRFFFFRTVGPLANRPIETTRDPNRNLCGSHL